MRPSASRLVSVFDNDGLQVVSVDVSISTDAVYSGMKLNISTSTPFYSNTMYYLLLDSGIYVCVSAMCVFTVGRLVGGIIRCACVLLQKHLLAHTHTHAHDVIVIFPSFIFTGVAVATAFCPIESVGVINSTEQVFAGIALVSEAPTETDEGIQNVLHE